MEQFFASSLNPQNAQQLEMPALLPVTTAFARNAARSFAILCYWNLWYWYHEVLLLKRFLG